MKKTTALYLVKNTSGTSLYVQAMSNSQAKRMFCQEYGISPSDPWSGLSNLSARKLKPEEVRAWEEKADANRDTLAFIEGMFEIGSKALAEQREQMPGTGKKE